MSLFFSSLNRDRPHILPLTQRVCLGKQEDSIVSSDGQLWSMALTTCSHCIRIHQPNQLKIWAFICILSCFQFHCWFLWDRYVQLDFDKMQPLQLHQDASTRWRFIFFILFFRFWLLLHNSWIRQKQGCKNGVWREN